MLTKRNLIIIIISIIVCCCSVNSFATDNTENYSSNVISLAENFYTDLETLEEYQTEQYYYYGFDFAGTLYVIFIEKNLEPKCYCNISSLGFDKTYSFIGYKGNGSTGNIDISTKYTGTIQTQPISYDNNQNKPYLSTNATIYTDNTYSTIFFQPAPLVIALPVEAKQIPKMVIQVLKILIPIGLVIFGMLLLISLVKLVILRMR